MPAFLEPYTYVPDPTGDRSMFSGEAFFGQPNTDPTLPANQITVRKVESDGSFTNLSQPVAIGLGGVVMSDGTPVQLDIVENNYSVLIRDRNNIQRYSFPSAGPGGVSGREVLISQGGLPYDSTVSTTGPTLTIDPLIHTNALILVDTSGGDVTFNLPSAALTGDKFRFICKKTTPDGNAIIIDPAGADRIDLQMTLRVQEQHEVLEVVTDGTNWWNIGSFLRSNGLRLRAVETRSTTNQTNISTNSASIAGLENSPRVWAAGGTNADGSEIWSFNTSVNRSATGVYDYSYDTALPSGTGTTVSITATPTTGQTWCIPSGASTTGFTISTQRIAVPDTVDLQNRQHYFVVIVPNASFT